MSDALDRVRAVAARIPARLDPWIAAVVAIGVRVAHRATLSAADVGAELAAPRVLDPAMYDTWARSIASGDWAGGSGVYFQDPLYAYALALVYAAGATHEAMLLVQTVLGALTVAWIGIAARRVTSRAGAFASALVAAIYLPAVYFDGVLMKTSLAASLVALAAMLAAEADARGDIRRWLAFGTVLGLAVLTRGNLLVVVPVAVGWAFHARSRSRGSDAKRTRGAAAGDRFRRYRPAIAVVLGCGAVLAATALRNRIVADAWVVSTANAGQNFFIGNNAANRDGDYVRLPFVDPNPRHEQRDFRAEAERRTGRSMTPPEVSRFWFREAFSWGSAHPGDWVALTVRKVRAYLGAYEIPDNFDYYLVREYAPVLRAPFPGSGTIVPLALLGLGVAWRRGAYGRFLAAMWVAYGISVVAFFVFARFRQPVVAFTIPLAVLGVEGGIAAIRRVRASEPRARRRAASWLVAGVAAWALANLPVRGPENLPGVRVARALGLPVRVETTATACYNLALAHAHEATRERPSAFGDAERWFLAALAQDDSRDAIHEEYAKLLVRAGRLADAATAYERAVRLAPGRWRLHAGLGIVEKRRGELAAAERALERAAALAPGTPIVERQLAEVRALRSGAR